MFGMSYYLGFDIGGTKSAAILGSETSGDIKRVGRAQLPTDLSRKPADFLESLFTLADGLLEMNGIPHAGILGAGISCGGPLDSATGVILSPPNLPGWDSVPVVEMVRHRFGVKARLQNDANACALAEWKYGAAKGCRHAVFLTFGTGMGAGLILNGKLYEGATGLAGEAGHVRLAECGPLGYGKEGSFEGFCSGGGIARLARTMASEAMRSGKTVPFAADGLEQVSAKAVAETAEAGDPLAREIFNICGRYLGRGLSILMDILNPEIIVIGSIFARSEALLREAMAEAINAEALPQTKSACRIVPADLGEALGDMAALATAAYDNE